MPTNSDFIVQFVDVSTWTLSSYFIFAGLIFLGLEILSRILPYLFSTMKEIPIKGKHLDELSFLDNLFIFMNKLLTVIFVYHLLIVVNSSSTIKWGYETLTMTNTIGSLLSFYVFYDFFYMLIHRMLHIKFLYPLIHKHHHRQKAPSRGNLDAINVHPIEFLLGEYLHLLTIYVIPCHIAAVIIFILFSGFFASLNHTRFDVNIPGIYSVKVHDVHHRLPESNYGQYIMLWDQVFGSYRSYDFAMNAKGLQA